MLLVDVVRVARPPGFFYTFGTNPLLAFVLSGLAAKTLGLIKWTAAALVIVVWYLVLHVCEKRGWYWKV